VCARAREEEEEEEEEENVKRGKNSSQEI